MFLTHVLLLSASVVGSATAATSCAANGNNCARAVTGTRDKGPNLATRSADCGSFLLQTVTAPTVITTNTASTRIAPTTTISPQPFRAKRVVTTVSSATLPAYASACTNAAQYASACGCLGVTASTTTVTPSTAVSVTATYGCVDPAVYNANAVHYPCPGTGLGNNEFCLCVLDVDGSSFCTPEGENCGSLADCDSDADCSAGLKCQVHTGCGGNVNKCTSDIADACRDPGLAVPI